MKFLTIAILAITLNSFADFEPCSTYTCDSLAVKAILDSNGLDSINVDNEFVTGVGNGRIVRLSLNEKDLHTIPPEIGNLNALVRLELSHNKLTNIPPEIGQLINLNKLYLDHNELSQLPEEILNLDIKIYYPPGLPPQKGLRISYNRLCNLPDSIEAWIVDNLEEGSAPQDCSTNIDLASNNNEIEISPNTSNGSITIFFKNNPAKKSLYIYKPNGSIAAGFDRIEEGYITWKIINCDRGVYYLQIIVGEKRISKKIVLN